jgi:2-oxo-4-hydroxy-4-carboxy-5-ureidoimidazoline decarboxylase
VIPLGDFNRLSAKDAIDQLRRCCGTEEWCEQMTTARPFKDLPSLQKKAIQIWEKLEPEDWLEAFRHHPRIGDAVASRARFGDAGWAGEEQKGAAGASEEVLRELAEGNRRYEARFGHIFLVCATGKSATEMLAMLNRRIGNDPETELQIAAGEQAKITQLRLEKLLTP